MLESGRPVTTLRHPRGLTERSHAEYIPGDTPASMIREDLVAEGIAIDSYGQMLACLRVRDPATRRMIEEVLANARGHADTLAGLLQRLNAGARVECA